MTEMPTDVEPQMTMLSTNRCPNSGEDYLRPESVACNPWALTVYGWCGWCWQTGRVPAAYRAALDARDGLPDVGGAA